MGVFGVKSGNYSSNTTPLYSVFTSISSPIDSIENLPSPLLNAVNCHLLSACFTYFSTKISKDDISRYSFKEGKSRYNLNLVPRS